MLRLATLLFTTSLVVASCGGDNLKFPGSSGSEPTPTPEATPTPSPAG